jgi:hypothetical protein
MNAILTSTLRKGDAQRIPNAASMLACGSPVRASSPNLKRCHLPRVEWMESAKPNRFLDARIVR